DKALSLGAKGGVYLGGGIIPKIADFVPQTDFVSRFKHKGPMSGYVSDIPVHMIINDRAALVGSAAWLINTVLAEQNGQRREKKNALHSAFFISVRSDD